VAVGTFILVSYWSAVTLGWALVRLRANLVGEPRLRLQALCRTCAIGMCLPSVIILLLGGWAALGFAALALLAPMVGYAPGLLRPDTTPPMYARAIARIKFGKYNEAEWEIIRELEKRENDFEGWLMLAELYADHFHDLTEAEQTILEICQQPGVTTSQVSVALHRLADWHLKYAGDPEAARRALRLIVERLKESHLARMAQLRINQLPATAADLRDQQSRPIPLPALRAHLEDEPLPVDSPTQRSQSLELASTYTARLRQDPNHAPTREKLARLLTEHLGRAEAGIEQLHLLLEMPDQPSSQRAEWLGLIAAWQLKYRHDGPAAHGVLERLVREYPESPQAYAARERLQRMKVVVRQT
jgi:hypothetical protein